MNPVIKVTVIKVTVIKVTVIKVTVIKVIKDFGFSKYPPTSLYLIK